MNIHVHSCAVHDAPRHPSRDPTDTQVLRMQFAGNLGRRWRRLSVLVRQAVVEQDLFSLSGLTPTGVFVLHSGSRLQALQAWFDYAMGDVVLGQDRGQWMGAYLRMAYERGRERAELLVQGTGESIGTDAELVTQSTIAEIQGVMEAVSQLVVREMFVALSRRARPALTARRMIEHIRKVGIVRSRTTANTMVVRAHAEATLDVFEHAGMRRVGIMPETLPPARVVTDARRKKRASRASRRVREELVYVATAGDDRVCVYCEELAEFGPYTITEARGMVPAHPNCRCAFVSEDDDE